MKTVALVLLVALTFAYLGLCAYGIAITGSTAGLADIGNAAVLSAGFVALAAFIRR